MHYSLVPLSLVPPFSKLHAFSPYWQPFSFTFQRMHYSLVLLSLALICFKLHAFSPYWQPSSFTFQRMHYSLVPLSLVLPSSSMYLLYLFTISRSKCLITSFIILSTFFLFLLDLLNLSDNIELLFYQSNHPTFLFDHHINQ